MLSSSMPNVSVHSQKKTNNSNHSEVDELEADVSTMEPTSPLPAQSLTCRTTNVTIKPEPGSAAWYATRKENHKNVERRRRETINQAMVDLVAVIPGNEKNKSKILRRAVQHIKQLMDQVTTLRKQNEEYQHKNEQQQVEIASLKARLDMQQQQQQQQKLLTHPIEISGSS